MLYSMRDRHSSSRGARTLAWTAAASLLLACGGAGGPTTRVTIPPGSSMRTAAESLARHGVVRSARLFRVYAAITRRDRRIKAGTYLLHRRESWGAVFDALHHGKGLMQVVTIPEGYSLAQIEPLLASRLSQPMDSVDAAVRDTALRRELDIPAPTLEGYLFPDTYFFAEGTTARTAVTAMVRRFEQIWQPEWTARLDSMHLSRNDVVTMASIVEKEARLGEERPVIAAVYYNRIRDGMLLQADPTVQYALGHHQARLYYKDLDVDSPYNTYRHDGLPPGPIASPGKASLVAALYPANVPYEYFVALPDGHHEFRVSLRQHLRAKAMARRAWNAVEAKRRADSARARKQG